MSANILVVDDLGSVRDTIKKMLERERNKVTTAASGAEALRSLDEHPFDAALIDVKMAQMDGLELLRRIRAKWPDLPVIMMTGVCVGALRRRCDEARRVLLPREAFTARRH